MKIDDPTLQQWWDSFPTPPGQLFGINRSTDETRLAGQCFVRMSPEDSIVEAARLIQGIRCKCPACQKGKP